MIDAEDGEMCRGTALVNGWVSGDSYCTVRAIEKLLARVPLTPRTTIV